MAAKPYLSLQDHATIRCSDEIRVELARIAMSIAGEADEAADEPGGYGMDMVIGTDRARAHVWPKTKTAKRAENKNAHLMGIAGSQGAV